MKNMSERIAALSPEKQNMLLQQLKEKTRQATPMPSDDWIVRYRPDEQARIRLFCLPYAGGGASIFRPWAGGLGPDVEVCGIQLPGHEMRLGENAYKRTGPLIQALAQAILPYLDRPFALYGHSMGALLSFELARQLRRAYDRLPLCLYIAAYRAPQLPNPNIKIYHLPSEVFKVVLRADGIPETILQNEELMQAMLPTLRADFELCDAYSYYEEPPLACPFVIFGGQDDVRVGSGDLQQWTMHSSASSRLSILPGSHFFLHSAQQQLLTEISQDLATRAQTVPDRNGQERNWQTQNAALSASKKLSE
jgi:medium-chain acyl-[acyl-carrier-protein] hydrolase